MKVAVIGGGVTGTTVTYELAKAGIETHLFEREKRLGGLASGVVIGDTMLDRFYRHIFVSDGDILGMADEVGMGNEIEFRAAPTGVYYDGKVWPFSGPKDILSFKPLPLIDRLRLCFHAGKILKLDKPTKYLDIDHIPAHEYIRRTMGPKVLKVIWEPLLKSKFDEHYKDVTAAWFWGKIRIRGQRSAKQGTGSEKLGYMKGGFQRLIDAMQSRFEQTCGHARLGMGIRSIRKEGKTFFLEHTESPRPEAFDAVVHCAAIPLLVEFFPGLPADYRQFLSQFDYQANICMILVLKQSLSPIYWLNINDPGCPFVGVIEHTNFRSPAEYGGHHCVYFTRYLSPANPLFAMDQEEVLAAYMPWIKKIFPNFREDWIVKVLFGKARYAQPIMRTNYSKILPPMHTPVEGLHLVTMSQIFPEDRGMNYNINIGRRFVKQFLETK